MSRLMHGVKKDSFVTPILSFFSLLATLVFSSPALSNSPNINLTPSNLTASNRLKINIAITAGTEDNTVDGYFIAIIPDGTPFFMRRDFTLGVDPQPLVSSWTVVAIPRIPFLDIHVGESWPVGIYKFSAFLVLPRSSPSGSIKIISESSISFRIEGGITTPLLIDTPTVPTEFTTYHVNPVNISPAVKQYPLDISAAQNLNRFSFSPKELNMLAQNGFFVGPTPSWVTSFHLVYKANKGGGTPSFITTDSLLHTFHILFDGSLRLVESNYFFQNLVNLTKAMFSKSLDQYNGTEDNHLKGILKKNIAYFSVALKLLDETFSPPEMVTDLVRQELNLIEKHSGFFPSPIFGYKEDYSQYVPRGHYTQNDTFKQFFKAMMWYGRIMFRLSPPSEEGGEEKGKEETLGAIFIVKGMNEIFLGNTSGLSVWDKIYEPTVFYVGKSDDLTVKDYIPIMKEIYGTGFTSLPLEEFRDEFKLKAFVEKAKTLRDPLINSSFIHVKDDPGEVTKGFRFMGQRFVPDSYIFQQLVFPKVSERLFPKGLDVMAVFGSERAYEILDKVYGETAFENYNAQMTKLRGEFASLTAKDWTQNLYWNWLYCLLPLLGSKGKGYPPFMQNPSWMDKDLNSALASWTELRHDTVLFAKPSGVPPSLNPTKGYVEPNPDLYGRLASLAQMLKEGLERRNLIGDELRNKINGLKMLLLDLKEISEKELTNQALSEREHQIIIDVGDILQSLSTFSPEISKQIESSTDRKMPIVVDVHTDPNTGKVLEEAVGDLQYVFVLVNIEDELKIARGAVFSYYEFLQPMDKRLTDEEWQAMLKAGKAPDLPVWMSSFVISSP